MVCHQVRAQIVLMAVCRPLTDADTQSPCLWAKSAEARSRLLSENRHELFFSTGIQELQGRAIFIFTQSMSRQELVLLVPAALLQPSKVRKDL